MVVALEPELDVDARKVLSLLPYALITVDREWRITFANHEAHRLLGQTGDTLWDLCPELEATPFGSAFRYAMSDRAELISESALPTAGWLQARARPLDDGLLITLRPIYPDNGADALQAKLLVGEIGFALTRAGSLREMLQRCADALVRHVDATLARIWTFDEVHHELVLEASAGAAEPETHDRVPIGRAKLGKIVERGAPYLTNDFQSDPRAGNREWAMREGIVAFAGYPLRIDDSVVGVLAVYGRHRFGHDTTGALATIADSIALGIERKQSDDARHNAEGELRAQAERLELVNEIGKNLTSELELAPLVQRVTNLATRIAHATFGAFFYDYDPVTDQFMSVAVTGAPHEAITLPLRPTQIGPATLGTHLPTSSFLAMPLVARGGKLVGALAFGHDQAGAFGEATERLIGGVAAQAAIAMDNARLFTSAHELISQLEKTNAELDQFAYVASHDLKAPLRGIANLSQWIEDDLGDAMDEQARYHMGLLRGRVARLENLIEGILAYSRADRGEEPVVDLDLAAFVREIWELIGAPATSQLKLHNLPPLKTQKIPLQQVLMNLMSNAVKYNDGNVNIEVGARASGDVWEDLWEIYVKDDGVGIPPEFHQRIWGLFQTLEPRDKIESTGIGLSVVRKIVEARGGRSWVESEAGAGATFWFTWPADSRARKKLHG